MTEPTPFDVSIDELTFDDLLAIALADLPGSSQGAWTLHGPVDPGMTVIEAFVYQLEQRLYMADQTTDGQLRASLRLLGLPDFAPATVATSVLCVRTTDPLAGPSTVGVGTVMSLADDTEGRQFALTTAVHILPVPQIEATGTLQNTGDTLELSFRYAGPVIGPAYRLTILAEVRAAPGVAPQWSAGATDVPPAAQLRWTATGPDGSEQPVRVADGSGGFRRGGLLALDWPGVWDRIGPGTCRLRATATTASYTEPVQLLGAYPNAAVAEHRVPRIADLSEQVAAFVPLPGQRLRLPEAPGTVCDAPGSVTVRLTEADGIVWDWTTVPSWTGIDPGTRMMILDRARGELVFGDGRAGRVPRPAPTGPATANYAVGGGPAGNIGARSDWVQQDGPLVATNVVPADGGADAETADAARTRAADALAMTDRTVTAEDAERLAMSTPGVGLQRALASVGFHPQFPCLDVPGALSVTIVPYADRSSMTAQWTPAPAPDSGALAAARDRLSQARLIGQETFVLPPTYRAVTAWVTLARTARDQGLQQRVIDALRRFLDPLVGGDDGVGWPFGGTVRLSALSGLVQSVLGPESVVTALSAALDGGTPSDCADLPIGPRQLVWLAAAHLGWTGTSNAGGGLQ